MTRRYIFLLAVLSVSGPGLAEEWLQWGGPNGDFTVDAAGLAEEWPAEGPRQLWKRPLGDGYSSILYKDGTLFTLYRDGEHEVVVALDAETGKTGWEHRYPRKLWPDFRKSFGFGPNSTPLILGDRILSVGVSGQMRCLDVTTGELSWEHDLPAKFGRRKRVEEWGGSVSPMPYDGAAITLVGGDGHAVVAFDPEDGSAVWKSEPGGVSYAQTTITRLAGRDQFIYFEPEGLVALDPATGRTLWRSAIEFNNGNHLTPIVKCDESHIWVGSQFDSGGGRLLEITRRGDALAAEQHWYHSKLQASHWTLIRLGDHIYGSTGGNRVSFLTAFKWKTGEVAWRERGFHKAQALYADGKLLFLDESGDLTLAKISPQGPEVFATARVTESVSWTLPTLVSTKLYLRDRKNVLALDLAKSAN